MLAEVGAQRGYAFTCTKDGSLFTPGWLAQFDAFFFYTSGDLSAPGKDGNPPISAAGKAALLAAVAAGKGFVGTHAAADTYHLGETPATDTANERPWRYRRLGDQADPYTRLIGAEFIKHGSQQVARASVADAKFPGLAAAGAGFKLMEEWYAFSDFSPDLHVILVQETAGMPDSVYQRPPYPSTWARLHGKGRVFYTGLGHREDVWLNPAFQEMLFGGLAWAVHDAEADVTPNLAQVTPRAYELAPLPQPPAAKK